MTSSTPQPNDQHMVNTMMLFDVEGVITNPLSGSVEIAVLAEIASHLQSHEPVAFNTGRGIDWIMGKIVKPLKTLLSYAAPLHNLCIVHEKGAMRTTFTMTGEHENAVIAPEIMIPTPELRADILAPGAQEFTQTMFPGDEKAAIISPEMMAGVDYESFRVDQLRLVQRLELLLQRHRCRDSFHIDPTRIATDVEDKRLGKALGARRVLEWLAERKIQITSFIAFGDSKSDIAMAEEIHQQGFPVEMVFVGESELIAGQTYPFPLTITRERCERGTLEYLQR